MVCTIHEKGYGIKWVLIYPDMMKNVIFYTEE